MGTPDLNGDGKPDILFQDSATGAISYWLMNGTSVTTAGTLSISLSLINWKVVGTPDFNRDGKADVLLQSVRDRKSTRLNSSHSTLSRMPSSA